MTSLLNALASIGFYESAVKIAQCPADIDAAEVILFPGVGSFRTAMQALDRLQFTVPLQSYLSANRPFMGICVGMQVLFSGSDENVGCAGLNVFDGRVTRFSSSVSAADDDEAVAKRKPVPHIGWSHVPSIDIGSGCFYFVHSFAVMNGFVDELDIDDAVFHWSRYGDEKFLAAIQRGNIFATQFHPEKSGDDGIAVIKAFLDGSLATRTIQIDNQQHLDVDLRVIACMDVCADEAGDVVVTKGASYDIIDENTKQVRKFGSPVDRAYDYYRSGADEIVFLNISGHQGCVLADLPMLKVLGDASKRIFVPLTVGGGIRSYTVQNDDTGAVVEYSALQVADAYFRAGADKISISSDAVIATQELLNGMDDSLAARSIGSISSKYGRQAVVISIDPVRNYVSFPGDTSHQVIETNTPGPSGERFVWFQCTIHGGRKRTDIDVVQLVKCAEEYLGVGEFMVNCIDKDGKNSGYDLELLALVKMHATVPVIASSGAGNVDHFSEAASVPVEACLAAGIFHRGEVTIPQVKDHLLNCNIPCRASKLS